MLTKLNLGNCRSQYLSGLIINLLFIMVLYSFDTSYKNLQIPEGIYQKNIWEYSDVMTYVDPAVNFKKFHVFGNNTTPDHFRTIGYPALIGLFYCVFGTRWLFAFQILQAIIFAFIYPIVTLTLKILMPNCSRDFNITIFTFLSISGAYFTRTTVVLPDTLFTLLFISCCYFGFRTYIKTRFWYLLLYLLSVTLAALIRPTLTLFPLLNLSIGYWIARQYGYPVKKTFVKSCLLSLVILCLINISTVRNYLNYSFLSPSSVIGINAFEYLSKKVLIMDGKTSEYYAYKEQVDKFNSISDKTKMRKTVMYRTILRHPISTIKVLGINTINVFLSNNLISNTANYFDYEWKPLKNSHYQYNTSKLLYFFTCIFMLLYVFLWLLFIRKVVDLFLQKDFKTLLLIFILFTMFIVPAILTGDGGGRFRLPFEHILLIFGLSTLFSKPVHIRNFIKLSRALLNERYRKPSYGVS
jgi:hypothetical protein